VAARLEELVQFRRPETCARVQIEDVASLVLLEGGTDVLYGIILNAALVMAQTRLSSSRIQHTT
jgi:hypothetical protein